MDDKIAQVYQERLRNIAYALNNEPVTMEAALALFDEQAEIINRLQADGYSLDDHQDIVNGFKYGVAV